VVSHQDEIFLLIPAASCGEASLTRGCLLRIITAITLATMIRKIGGIFAQPLTHIAPIWVKPQRVHPARL